MKILFYDKFKLWLPSFHVFIKEFWEQFYILLAKSFTLSLLYCGWKVKINKTNRKLVSDKTSPIFFKCYSHIEEENEIALFGLFFAVVFSLSSFYLILEDLFLEILEIFVVGKFSLNYFRIIYYLWSLLFLQSLLFCGVYYSCRQSWALNTFFVFKYQITDTCMLKMYLNTKYFLQMYLNTKYIDVFKYFFILFSKYRSYSFNPL